MTLTTGSRWESSGPGSTPSWGRVVVVAQGESTTVLHRLARGSALCGANNICNLLDNSHSVASGGSRAEHAAVPDLSAASQASTITTARDSPAPSPSRPHSSSRTRHAYPNPNGRRRSQDWRQRLPRPVPSIQSPLRSHPSAPSPPPPSHCRALPAPPRSEQVHRRRIRRPNSASNTPRLEPR